MGLTATASKANQAKIQQLLCMHEPFVIAKSPDRPNITLQIEKVTSGVECLDWIVETLGDNGKNCTKVLIYCRTFKDCTQVYRYFNSYFGGNSPDLTERTFDMVHSKTPDNIKVHVQDAIQLESSNLRVVIATKIIGMGLDLSVDMIIHYGLPSNLEDYLQQIGRSGRRGQQAHAILLYSSAQLRNVDSDMMRVAKSDMCIRKEMLKGFDMPVSEEKLTPHLCCNVCKHSCKCGHCSDSDSLYEIYKANNEHLAKGAGSDSEICRTVRNEEKESLKRALIELKDKLDRQVYLPAPVYGKPDLIHGLDIATIKTLLDNSEFLFSADDIIAKCGLIQYESVCQVVQVFSTIFTDMDEDIEVGEDIALEEDE